MGNMINKTYKKLASILLVSILVFNFLPVFNPAFATINETFNFQAKLTNVNGTNVSDGTYNFRFSIYNASAAGDCLWTAKGTIPGTGACTFAAGTPGTDLVALTVTNGLLNTQLGTTAGSLRSFEDGAASLAQFSNNSLYLDIQIYNGSSWETFGSRKLLEAVPYAFRSKYSDNAGTSTNVPISGLTLAGANNSINNGNYNQTWNWALTSASQTGLLLSENTASVSTGTPSILGVNTLASSTAIPIYVQNIGGALSFRVDDQGSDTSPFVVDASGKVGIGTDAPAAFLHIKSGGGVNSGINLEATSAASYGVIDFNTASGLAGQFLATGASFSNGIFTGDQIALASYINTGSTTLVAGGTSGYINFATGGYSASNERMRIIANGNVGIGDTTPAALFTVGNTDLFQVNSSGQIAAAAGIVSSGTIQFSALTSNGALYTSGGNGTLTTTAPTSGALGYWSRTSTTLSPTTANDILSITGNSGDIFTLTSSATGASNKALNISQTGATTGTDYAGYFSNTGAATTNVGLYASASGATNNYGLIVPSGFVGVGTSTPQNPFDIVRGTAGSMNKGTYESASFEYDGDNKVGIYTNTAFGSGASLVFGNTGTTDVNGYYPGFETQFISASAVASNYMRYNFIERNAAGTVLAATTDILVVTGDGKVKAPISFNAGGSDQFQVNSTGNIIKINNVTTSFPGSQGGVDTYLKNNGSGTLTWASVSSSSAISGLTLATGTNTIDNTLYAQTWNWSTLTTENALSLSANGITTGNLFSLSSSSTALTSASLLNILATGSPAASWTGALAKIEYTTSTDTDINGDALRIGITGAGAGQGTALNVTSAQTGTNALAFRVNDDGTYTDSSPFIIDKSGNLGIGVTSVSSGRLNIDSTLRLVTSGTPEAGYLFGTSIPSGSFTEASGELLSYGINVPQVGTRDDGRLGGIFRLDSRSGYETESFVVYGYPSGGGSGYNRFSVNLQTGDSYISPVAGNVTVGSTTLTSLFNVGTAAQFQVNSSGNIVKINNVTTSFPGSQGGSNTYLKNDGAGNLTWSSSTFANVAFNTFTAAAGTNTIDNTLYAQQWDWGTLTTENALTLTGNGITTGNLLSLTSTSTALTSSNLLNILATGNPAASWTSALAKIEYTTSTDTDINGDALRIGITGAGAGQGTALNVTTAQTGTNALAFRVNDDGTYTDSTSFVVDKTGAVGIGTTAPGARLTVTGGNILLDNGSKVYMASISNGAGYYFDGSSAWGLRGYNSGSNYYTDILFDSTGGSGNNSRGIRLMDTNGSNVRLFVGDTGNVGVGDVSPAGMFTVGSGDLFQVSSLGNVTLNSVNTTQTTTSSIVSLNGNSLTSGTGFYGASSTLSSGSLVNLLVTGTAAASNTQKVLNISTSGNNATTTQTTYGLYATNTHTGTSATNIGGYFSASGASNNIGIDIYGTGTMSTNYGLRIQNMGQGTGISISGIGTDNGGVGLDIGASTGGDVWQIRTGDISGYAQTSSILGQLTLGNTVAPTSALYNTFTIYGIKTGTISGGNSGSNSFGLELGANSANTGANYGIKVGAISGTATTNIGVNIGAVSGATSNYALITNGGNVGIGDTSPLGLLTVGSGDLFQVSSLGNVTLNSVNTTQTTTSSIVSLNGNSLTSGTGLYASSSTLSSGSLIDLSVNSTAAASNTQKAINILTTGANGSNGQSTYGIYSSNTHSGSNSSNFGGYFNASGGTYNYAAVFNSGNVGIGNTSPVYKLDITGSTNFSGNTINTSGVNGIADQESLITNTGFEINDDGSSTNPDGWGLSSISGSGGTGGVSTTSIQGTNAWSLVLSANTDGASIFSGCIPITGGNTYSLYVFARDLNTASNTNALTLRLATYTSAANCSSRSTPTNYDSVSNGTVTTTYAQYGGNVNPASTQFWGRVYVIFDTPTTADTFYADSVRLTVSSLAAGVDLAENFPIESGFVVDAGDIVSVSSTNSDSGIKYIKKSSGEFDSNVIGIVSTRPGITLDDGNTYAKAKVALAGRVPVKISSLSEAIKAGDYITSSSEEGKAMKASRTGQVIGKALNDWDPLNPTDKIVVLIDNSYYYHRDVEFAAFTDRLNALQNTVNGQNQTLNTTTQLLNTTLNSTTSTGPTLSGGFENLDLSKLTSLLTKFSIESDGSLMFNSKVTYSDQLSVDNFVTKKISSENSDILIELNETISKNKLLIANKAGVELFSIDYKGNARFSKDVTINGDLYVDGKVAGKSVFESKWVEISPNSEESIKHNLGEIPRSINILRAIESDCESKNGDLDCTNVTNEGFGNKEMYYYKNLDKSSLKVVNALSDKIFVKVFVTK